MYSKEQLFQLKGELTYNIEILNARLIECNKQIAALMQKEANNDVQPSKDSGESN